jgi:hypothetical protein
MNTVKNFKNLENFNFWKLGLNCKQEFFQIEFFLRISIRCYNDTNVQFCPHMERKNFEIIVKRKNNFYYSFYENITEYHLHAFKYIQFNKMTQEQTEIMCKNFYMYTQLL